MAYSDKVLDHYNHPRNVGSLDKNDPNVGTGMVGAPECGDVMKLQVKVNPETGVIEDAKFKTFGCGSAIASSSLATEWLKGKTVEEALAIKNTDIVAELSLPPVKIHCSVLAEDAIRAAINVAKLNVIPIRRGYWGNKIGKPHTISSRVTGKCGSVLIKLVPAPRGTGLVASPTVKKILQFAGIQDAFTKSNGHTKTVQNTSYATFHACAQAYKFLSPDLWADAPLKKAPFQEHSEFLAKSDKTRKR